MKAIPHFVDEGVQDIDLFDRAMIKLNAPATADIYCYANSFPIIWTRGISTAATDGVYTYINPDYFASLPSDLHRVSLFVHELLHIVLRHVWRGKALKKSGIVGMVKLFCKKTRKLLKEVAVRYNAQQFNIHADEIINAEIIRRGLPVMDNWIKPSDPAYITNDLTVEEIYRAEALKKLEQEQEQEQEQELEQDEPEHGEPSDEEGDSESDESESGEEPSNDPAPQGSGEPDEEGEGEDTQEGGAAGESAEDGDEDPTGGTEPAGHDHHLEPKYEGDEAEQEAQAADDADEVERTIENAVNMADQMGQPGKARGSRCANPTVSDSLHGGMYSSIDWREMFADRFQRATGYGEERNYNRINKRAYVITGMVLPTPSGQIKSIVYSVDISGSVSRAALRDNMAELAQQIDVLRPTEGTTVLFVDDHVRQVHEVYSGDELLELQVPWGGCTEMSAALDWIEANGLTPDLHVCFTDGELYEEDMQRLADEDVFICLDSRPWAGTSQMLERTGAEYIVARDNA